MSRPNRKLTPGVIAVTDVNRVCESPLQQHTHVSRAIALQVYGEYGIAAPTSASDASPYRLDYLVPLTLGGAPVVTNVWPAAVAGIGFKEKQQLTTKLRVLVCQSEVSLASVQRQLEVDWYQLWLKYVYTI